MVMPGSVVFGCLSLQEARDNRSTVADDDIVAVTALDIIVPADPLAEYFRSVSL